METIFNSVEKVEIVFRELGRWLSIGLFVVIPRHRSIHTGGWPKLPSSAISEELFLRSIAPSNVGAPRLHQVLIKT